jgi:CRISPR-associated protein Csx10|nr:hypothetical protein [Candidatus Cloacimonadota bacterium]
MNYTLKLLTLSDSLIGSALSYGSIIDSDIVFDARGLPYIPAKRVKGLFRDAATDLIHNTSLAQIFPIDSGLIETFYGSIGNNNPNPSIIFQNLQLDQFQDIEPWIDYLMDKYDYAVNIPSIQNYFTEIRTQTAIDPQTKTAKEHSLRTSRVLKKEFSFSGEIIVSSANEGIQNLLALSCLYIRRMGSMRNRGFGKVQLDLVNQMGESVCLEVKDKLEASCIN